MLLVALTTVALALQPSLQPTFQSQPTSQPRGPRRTSSLLAAAGGEAPTNFVSKQWATYLRMLEEKPMLTKMATSAVLSGTGDVIAQAIEGSSGFALRRFLTLISVNVLYIVPILTAFYAANEALSNRLKLAAGWKRTGVQLAFDQLLNAPIVICGFFCSFQLATAVSESLATGAPFALGAIGQAIRSQLKASYVSTVISNWKIWVLPQLINFAFVPPFARVAFANFIALIWNVVLSVVANESV